MLSRQKLNVFDIWESFDCFAYPRNVLSVLSDQCAPLFRRPESLSNVLTLWAAEVRHFCRHVPIILVGNKTDLRADPELLEMLARLEQAPVTPEQARYTAGKIKADAYVECSAKLKQGVQEVFQAAAQAAIRRRRGMGRFKSSCALL